MPVSNYKIRVGIEGSRCSITFYDTKDDPLTTEVTELYPTVSAALAKAFREYIAGAGHIVKAN